MKQQIKEIKRYIAGLTIELILIILLTILLILNYETETTNTMIGLGISMIIVFIVSMERKLTYQIKELERSINDK